MIIPKARVFELFTYNEDAEKREFIGSVKACTLTEAAVQLASDRLDRDKDGLYLTLYPMDLGTEIVYRPGIGGAPLWCGRHDALPVAS